MIEATADNQPLALLLDLSGNERAAHQWATNHLNSFRLQTLSKAELKWSSKRQALTRIRTFKAEVFAIFTGNLDLQSSRCAMFLFGTLAGAKRVVFADRKGRMIVRSLPGVFLLETPRFALELLVSYLVIVPFSWLLIILLSGIQHLYGRAETPAPANNKVDDFRGDHRGSPVQGDENTSQSALYIRATLSDAKEGGMATHVAGFASGVRELGHHLDFLICGEPDDAPATDDKIHTISPSATISATRAIFELWNNLAFTIQALGYLRQLRKSGKRFDFLYQRYSRFTFAGVVMSLWTGLPLALEFNGSEVWVSQSWDPVGQLSLLKRFERLNLRAAAFIFTVSEVERRNLIQVGVEAEKIIVNLNGVDVNRFHPGARGTEIRRRLNIDRQIVTGFLGTFGPWHGAPVLAEAATRLDANCHLLFIGDGDERPVTEEKLGEAKTRATFVGRIAHTEVPDYLDACDILVAPHVPASDGSDFFGSPTKLFEYMAMEKAVIASRLGQIADVIIDGENGLLVPPNDSAALAAAIEKLANDERLRLQLGRAARQTVMENYTWRDNAARVFTAIKNGKGCSANEDDGQSRLAM